MRKRKVCTQVKFGEFIRKFSGFFFVIITNTYVHPYGCEHSCVPLKEKYYDCIYVMRIVTRVIY